MLGQLFRRAFFLAQWQVGWSRIRIGDFIDAPTQATFNWICPEPKEISFADPFGFEIGSGLQIYAERVSHSVMDGRIVRLDVRDNARETAVLAKPWHLSYPFIVEHGQARFLVPEQRNAGHLAFYPLSEDGTVEETPTAVLENMAVLDGTLLHRDGYWWLFAASPDIETGNGGLLLFFSERLTGPYTAHPSNPIVTDRRCARPAGRIIDLGDRLLRPGQDSMGSYGEAISLSEITVLDARRYAEHLVTQIRPGDLQGGFPLGTHHLDHTENYVLVDSRRSVFCWYAPWLKLKARLSTKRRS